MGIVLPTWVPWLALPLIALGSYFLMSQEPHKVDDCQAQTETIKEEKIIYPHGLKLESVKIEECEYWYGYGGGVDSTVLTHKGNCNNPIHIYNREIQ